MSSEAYRYRPVWDPFLRVLHWWNALTLLFVMVLSTVMLIFGNSMKPAERAVSEIIHSLVGYAFSAGLLARIVWLFVGPQTASWRDFLPLDDKGRKVLVGTFKYYLSGFRSESPLYRGHNPLAGMVYLTFFVVAAIQVLGGVIIMEIPPDLRKGLWLVELHEALYYLVLAYIMIHLPAVLLHEWGERQGLLGSMVHGCKTFTDDQWEQLGGNESEIVSEVDSTGRQA